MNYSPTHTNQVVATPISPIMNIAGSVATPNQNLSTGGNNIGLLPNYGSVYTQLPPTIANSTPTISSTLGSSSAKDDVLASIREEMAKMLRESFGVELPRNRMYQKPYPEFFDRVQCPPGYRIPDFVKFSGDGTKTTWEHISYYLAQLGEISESKELKIRLFPLSLTGTTFSWFSSLPHGSILAWHHLEQKFHDHFYSGDNELKMSHLTSVKEKNDELVSDYVKRFRDKKPDVIV